MKTFPLILLTVISLLSFAVAASAINPTVKIAEKEEIGTYLTDEAGMTLYWFKNDAPGRSTCTGPCIDRWPAFYGAKVIPPAGVAPGEFGSITREDGSRQTTYRGYPLYYWLGDRKAGDTNGNMIGNVWFVVNPGIFRGR